jgi:hypothetical protein
MRVLYRIVAMTLVVAACANAALGWEAVEVDVEVALGHLSGSLLLLGIASIVLWRGNVEENARSHRPSSFADLPSDV